MVERVTVKHFVEEFVLVLETQAVAQAMVSRSLNVSRACHSSLTPCPGKRCLTLMRCSCLRCPFCVD